MMGSNYGFHDGTQFHRSRSISFAVPFCLMCLPNTNIATRLPLRDGIAASATFHVLPDLYWGCSSERWWWWIILVIAPALVRIGGVAFFGRFDTLQPWRVGCVCRVVTDGLTPWANVPTDLVRQRVETVANKCFRKRKNRDQPTL